MDTGFAAQTPRARLRWRFADAMFDEASLQLTLAGQPVDLERRPLQLLALLLAHAGEIVTKDEILDALWPGREVSEASLTTCMTRLRQALGPAGHSAIRTVHGYGYRFSAPVSVEATAPAPLPQPARTTLAEGDPVPHRPNWRLLRRLGTGGYGDAWLAEQCHSHERRVFKFAGEPDGVAALRREVALFRLLREGLGPRPDLIRILDWHFADSPAFLETAWAEPGNLADWAARQGGVATLPLDLRLDLAAQIADALAAIHSLSVLHKDLKPANVLMRTDEAGGPAILLTDFGSGRALDPARLDAFGITRPAPDPTQADSSGGTHMYRAPETFAGGAPTMQGDIFALGVILFQLAAGDLRRPLAAGWESVVADPLLREDIAAAAAGDPASRLADAADLAARLRALPQRRAARARAEAEARESARVRRDLELARARRAPLLALVAVLLLACGVSFSLYVRAGRAQARAEAQASRARAVSSFLTDDLFSAADPGVGADPNEPVRNLLAIGAADLDRRFPAGTLDRADMQAAIGDAYAGLADPDHALPLLRQSLATRRAQLGDAAPETQAVRLEMMDLAERTLDRAGTRAAAEAVLAAHPADPATELRARLAILTVDCAREGLGGIQCVSWARPLLADMRRRLGDNHPLTLRMQAELAVRLAWRQQLEEAIPLARDSVARTTQVFGPDHLLVQERRYDLATVLIAARKASEAIAMLQDIRVRLLAMSGTETELSARIANALGAAFNQAGRYEEAASVLRLSTDYNVRRHGELYEPSRWGYNNLAESLDGMGREKDAIALGEKDLDLVRRAIGPDHRDAIWQESNLADFYRRDGNLPHAEMLDRDVVERARRVFGRGEYDLGVFDFHLGEVLALEHKPDEARAMLAASVAILTKSVGPDNQLTVHAASFLATVRQK